MPQSEVVDLHSADAEHDFQYLRVRHIQRQRRIQTGTSLLDPCEVETSGVRDRLHPPLLRRAGRIRLGLVRWCIRVAYRDRRLIADRERAVELRSKIGVQLAAITRVPAQVDAQLLKIR